VSKAQAKLVNSYYMRDDGALMIEVAPGQFIGKPLPGWGWFIRTCGRISSAFAG
jgi:hypothetical protein